MCVYAALYSVRRWLLTYPFGPFPSLYVAYNWFMAENDEIAAAFATADATEEL